MSHKPDVSTAELAEFAVQLARAGGEIALSYFGHVQPERKIDHSLVTEADHAVQNAVFSAIADRFPDHAVLGEETIRHPQRHPSAAATDYCWVVDPIDGTRNFARGVECYITSVGLLLRGRPIVAALHDPPAGRLFAARSGGGATLDGNPIHAGDRPIDADTSIAQSTVNGRRLAPLMKEWMETYVFRNAGSLCTHLIWVARGWCDGAFSAQAKLWDIAAGALLIEEAGGIVTDPVGKPIWPIDVATYHGADIPILAGTPIMHARMLETVRKFGEMAPD